jgi:hypothetical protein
MLDGSIALDATISRRLPSGAHRQLEPVAYQASARRRDRSTSFHRPSGPISSAGNLIESHRSVLVT